MNIAGSDSYIYILFEHKSYNDTLPIVQILQYIIKTWELHLKQNKNKDQYKTKKLPIVLPVLLYHGKEKWSSGRQLIDSMEEHIKEFAQFIPNFEILLYDLSDYSDDELKGNAAIRVVLLMLKHIFDDDFPSKFEEILGLFKEVIESETGLKSYLPLLRYVFSTRNDLSPKDIAEMVTKQISMKKGDEVMTLAEKLREEGEKIGEKRGKVETAQNVLIILAEDKFIVLSKSVINDIKSIENPEILDWLFLKTLSCDSLEDFKNMVHKAKS